MVLLGERHSARFPTRLRWMRRFLQFAFMSIGVLVVNVDQSVCSQELLAASDAIDLDALASEHSLDEKSKLWLAELLTSSPEGRIHLAVPGRGNGPSPRGTKLSVDVLRTLAEKRATLAFEHLERGFHAESYAELFRVAALDSRNPNVMQILGTPSSRLSQRKVTAKSTERQNEVGWLPGSYSQVLTPHFTISSQTTPKIAAEVADYCEQTFCQWQQLFFDYWADRDWIAKRRAGVAVRPPKAQFQVVLFRNREDYLKALKNLETNIEVSTGYYHPSTQTSFFYWGDPRSLVTLRHELTHQFFQEFTDRKVALDPDDQSGMWLVEGIAMFMESACAVAESSYDVFEIGGWDAPRLQAARYRRLHDEFWIPMEEMFAETGKRLRARSDIRMFYTQAAGLAHMLMESGPQHRQALMAYLESVYSGQPNPSVFESIFADDDRWRAAYDRYLLVTRTQVAGRPNRPSRRDVVLSRTDVRAEDLLAWSHSMREADWFDLSFTKVDDSLFQGEPAWNPQRLNLEGTAVTDHSFEAIRSMPRLMELDLSGCNITSNGIQRMAGHPKLTTLWLTDTAVDDSILDVLKTLKKLEYVNLDGTRVTDEGWKRIRQALPKLK